MKKQLISFLVLLAMIFAALPVVASAETEIIDNGTCGEKLIWTWDESGTLTISGTGAMYDGAPWSELYVNAVVINDGVTSIGKDAFSYLYDLTSVTIPSSVTSIGDSAFAYCYGLSEVTIPNSVTHIGNSAFSYCISLTSVTIPNGITGIADYTFNACYNLDSVTIPSSVTAIGNYAFEDCDSLSDVYYQGKQEQWSTITIGKRNDSLTNATIQTLDLETTGITVKTLPDKTRYVVRDALDLTGLTLTATHDDGSTATVTKGFAVSNVDLSESGTKTVTVTYNGYSASFNVTVYDGVCGDDLMWTLDEEGTLTISGTGEMYDGAPWSGRYIKTVVIENGVTSIGDAAFNNCTSLTQVTIPNSVTSIGDAAFATCDSLSSVTIPNSVTAIGNSVFYGCTDLTQVTIPNSVTTIGAYAFAYCDSLSSVTIPGSVSSIGNYAFDGCGSLKNVHYNGTKRQWDAIEMGYNQSLDNATLHTDIDHKCGENLTWTLNEAGTLTISGTGDMYAYVKADSIPWYDNRSSIKAVVIQNGVTGIGSYAFYGCANLTAVTIPGSVTTIGDSAFYECSGLTSVTIPSGVTAIGNSAFYNCGALTAVTIPGSVTTIGNDAFGWCTKLTAVSIPNGVTSIGGYAFRNCSSLTTVTIPKSVTSIGSSAFFGCSGLNGIWVDANNAYYCSDAQGVLFNKNKTVLMQAPRSISGSYAVPESVKSIDGYAFYSCNRLSAVSIPNSVTGIGEWAFCWCSGLTKVSMSNSVASIGNYAFSNCGSLSDVYYNGTQEQWNGIAIGEGNTALTAAARHTIGSNLKFSGASLTLESNLAVNYKVKKALLEEYGFTDPYVIVEMNGRQTKLTQYTVDGDKYAFSFRNIAPHQMGDTLTATLYATYNGVEISGQTRDYSVTEYCYSMLDKYADNVKFRTLLVDLLHYGAASQNYTGYKTDSLVDKDLTAVQQQWATSSDPALKSVLNTAHQTVENPTAKWKGASLYLKEAVAMRLKFSAENIDGLVVQIKSGSNTWTISSDKFQKESDGVYYVDFEGLNAGQMRQAVYLTICKGNTPVSNTACYSIESYAHKNQNITIDGLGALLKAMMKYGDSAYAYVN